jgi:CubicO group peptidase (beta-lactamase class C family)
MRLLSFILAFISVTCCLNAQLYFPPNNISEWETIDPSSLGWCQNQINDLYSYLDDNNTKAFILLKDGKIVLEEYFNGHSVSDNWYWASAGKTLTALSVGIAQQENLLVISDPSSSYLGQGWTSLTTPQEQQITIKNQLSMTSGLDDSVTDPTCTDPTCLEFLSDSGSRWAYHNAPYTLLTNVVENAAGVNFNQYLAQKILTPTGMDGAFIPVEYNRVFFSTARSMARFGLLVLNDGNWDGIPLITDVNYFNDMVNTSQDFNEAYGYLWWLNGKDSYMIPNSQTVFSGSFNPNAPDDMISGMGANGQFVNVIPSKNMVWIRMGEAPENIPVPYLLNDAIWTFINQLDCNLAINETTQDLKSIKVFPNPVSETIYIEAPYIFSNSKYTLYSVLGEVVMSGNSNTINVVKLNQGIYFLSFESDKLNKTFKIIKQ